MVGWSNIDMNYKVQPSTFWLLQKNSESLLAFLKFHNLLLKVSIWGNWIKPLIRYCVSYRRKRLQWIFLVVFIMVQLTVQEQVFIVRTYFETHSFQEIHRLFVLQFPQKTPPVKATLWKTVKKYLNHGTSLNRNPGNSGRKRASTCQNMRSWCRTTRPGHTRLTEIYQEWSFPVKLETV